MSYEIRPVTEEEFPKYARSIGTVFGNPPSEEAIGDWLTTTELDRTLAVFDGDEIVGTDGAISFQLTVPGLQTVPAAGVTAVTVMPTHRRQGVLRAMMERQLRDVQERGEPLAILLASESIIYGRFGYGMATTQASYQIDPRYADFQHSPEGNGRVRMLDREAAAGILPEVYDRYRCIQPGAVTRTERWWERYLRDPERWRGGLSERMYVVYESSPGQVDGYAAYRIKGNWEGNFADSTLVLVQLMATTAESRAALWRYCLGVDLMTTVQADNFPVEEPLRWMLADPRRLRTRYLGDYLWVRPVDIPATLCARRYAAEGKVVFEVRDAFRPESTGVYRLEGGPDGATASRTDAEPDIALSVADLGAAYLGGVGFTTLARAGRVMEKKTGSLRRADAMFACEPQAWCATDF